MLKDTKNVSLNYGKNNKTKNYSFITKYRLFSRSARHSSENSTNIIINNQNIDISFRKNEIFDSNLFKKRIKSKEKEKNASIFDIKNVCFKEGEESLDSVKFLAIGIAVLAGIQLSSLTFGKILTFFEILEIMSMWIVFFLVMLGFIYLVFFFFRVPFKSFCITFKDNTVISFPYYRRDYQDLNCLLDDIKQVNKSIKVIYFDKLIKVILMFVVLFLGFCQLFLCYVDYKENTYIKEEEKINSVISNNDYYSKEGFIKLKYIKRDNNFGYNIYEDTHTKKIVKIKESAKLLREFKEYKAFLIEFYSKDTNELIAKRYQIVTTLSNNFGFLMYGYNYQYQNNKLYKFRESNNTTIDFFDRQKEELVYDQELNKNSIYDFVYSDDMFQTIDDKIFKSYEKIEFYNSIYGRCYIIEAKGILSKDTAHIMYIEIEDSTYEGIMMEFKDQNRIYDSKYAINHFKKMLPEQ